MRAVPAILITGATGTVGSLLAAELASAGETVRGATRTPEKAQLPKGVIATRFDYSDEKSVREALVRHVSVAHLAR